jgi:hypothetical protein
MSIDGCANLKLRWGFHEIVLFPCGFLVPFARGRDHIFPTQTEKGTIFRFAVKVNALTTKKKAMVLTERGALPLY